jgi:hypothetical protein
VTFRDLSQRKSTLTISFQLLKVFYFVDLNPMFSSLSNWSIFYFFFISLLNTNPFSSLSNLCPTFNSSQITYMSCHKIGQQNMANTKGTLLHKITKGCLSTFCWGTHSTNFPLYPLNSVGNAIMGQQLQWYSPYGTGSIPKQISSHKHFLWHADLLDHSKVFCCSVK